MRKGSALLVLGMMIGSAAAMAQSKGTPRQGPGEHGGPPVPPIMKVLDTNGDGALSASEAAKASTAIMAFDLNKDGLVSLDEMAPPRPLPPVLAALDGDKNGTISSDELSRSATALMALDANGDGQLALEEYMPPPPPGHGGRGQGSGPDRPGDPMAGLGPDQGSGARPPLPPVEAALDANGDGIISQSEIARSTAAMVRLDANGDGQLTLEEVGPPPPPGPGGPPMP